jgi:putative ABC transport system ATP-binding protein
MLELKNIYKTFNPGTINEKVALNGLNLTLNEGDFVTVIGGNGAGKSTMLNAVAGTWMVLMLRNYQNIREQPTWDVFSRTL